MEIGANLNNLKQTIPAGCTLVAVSKTQAADRILEAYETGHRVFGENKVQELLAKYEVLPKDIQWHFIGHLQTNKVKFIAPFVSLIHSVDSTRLLEEINKQGGRVGRVIPCLLQIHIAQEETKYGFSAEEVTNLLESGRLADFPHVRVIGLMGMATFTDDTHQVREEFRGLKDLFDRLKAAQIPHAEMKELSMGMSGDFPIALEEGSTMIRVGTAIFGERVKPHPRA